MKCWCRGQSYDFLTTGISSDPVKVNCVAAELEGHQYPGGELDSATSLK